MSGAKTQQNIRRRRARRTRSNIFGTGNRPRLSVFRSAQLTYAQLIDDTLGKTLAAASTQETKEKKTKKDTKTNQAYLLGELIAKKAATLGIKEVIFDKGSYAYHGRVKAVAEGARKAGLKI